MSGPFFQAKIAANSKTPMIPNSSNSLTNAVAETKRGQPSKASVPRERPEPENPEGLEPHELASRMSKKQMSRFVDLLLAHK